MMNNTRTSVIVSPSVIHSSKPADQQEIVDESPSNSAPHEVLRMLARKSFDAYAARAAVSTLIAAKDRLRSSATPSTLGGNGGNSEQSANRMSYPREFKLLVISYYFQHGQNKYRTCKEFQITKSMLNGWLQKVDKIQESRPGSLKSGRSGRKPQFPTVEKQLFHVYHACLTAGKKVGNRWLRETAKLIAQEQCSPEELNGMCQFSERWLCNFKKRYSINLTKDWNCEFSGSAAPMVKPSSDGASYSPTPETCSSPTNFEADSSTSPKKSESPSTVERQSPNNDEEQSQPPPSTDDEDKSKLSIIERSEEIGNGNTSSSVVVPSSLFNKCVATKIAFQPYEPGRRGRKVQFPQVEEILYKNLCQKQADGVRVSNRWLQDEARRLAVQLCPEMFTNAFKSARCMFSEHWLHNFKKRYGVSLKQQQQQRVADQQISMDSAAESLSSAVTASKTLFPANANTQIAPDVQQQFNLFDFQNSIALRQAAVAAAAAYNRFPGGGNGDDLPTMVPLTTLSQSLTKINLAEWYSKVVPSSSVELLAEQVRLQNEKNINLQDKKI